MFKRGLTLSCPYFRLRFHHPVIPRLVTGDSHRPTEPERWKAHNKPRGGRSGVCPKRYAQQEVVQASERQPITICNLNKFLVKRAVSAYPRGGRRAPPRQAEVVLVTTRTICRRNKQWCVPGAFVWDKNKDGCTHTVRYILWLSWIPCLSPMVSLICGRVLPLPESDSSPPKTLFLKTTVYGLSV